MINKNFECVETSMRKYSKTLGQREEEIMSAISVAIKCNSMWNSMLGEM